MGEVVRFIPKSELERARLIREARAKYESIFPTEKVPDGERPQAGSSTAHASKVIRQGV
jgi:hypothetical protein